MRTEPRTPSELRELLDADAVNPLGNHDLGVFAVPDIAPENTGAALPAHSVAGTPDRADPGGNRRRALRLALARFARRAPRQSLSTGHVLYPQAPKLSDRHVLSGKDLIAGIPAPANRPAIVPDPHP